MGVDFSYKYRSREGKEKQRLKKLNHSFYYGHKFSWNSNDWHIQEMIIFPSLLSKSLHHHQHHIALVARISLTLSRHSSLSFIALGRSSGQHPVSSHSCWMYVRAGRPAFARPCVGIHKSTSLMSSSLLLQQCPACLVRLTWIVFVIGGRWPYSWCLVGCCCQDLFRIACAKGVNFVREISGIPKIGNFLVFSFT